MIKKGTRPKGRMPQWDQHESDVLTHDAGDQAALPTLARETGAHPMCVGVYPNARAASRFPSGAGCMCVWHRSRSSSTPSLPLRAREDKAMVSRFPGRESEKKQGGERSD